MRTIRSHFALTLIVFLTAGTTVCASGPERDSSSGNAVSKAASADQPKEQSESRSPGDSSKDDGAPSGDQRPPAATGWLQQLLGQDRSPSADEDAARRDPFATTPRMSEEIEGKERIKALQKRVKEQQQTIQALRTELADLKRRIARVPPMKLLAVVVGKNGEALARLDIGGTTVLAREGETIHLQPQSRDGVLRTLRLKEVNDRRAVVELGPSNRTVTVR